jgi:hypothetical protein
MTLEEMIRELAAGLRDVIQDASLDYIDEDPENAFLDLATTLVLRLRDKLTIVPVTSQDRVQAEQNAAAGRILDIFTRWMRENPDRSYVTRISPSGKFQIVVKDSNGTELFFGQTIQDACAQAAQTICLEGEP